MVYVFNNLTWPSEDVIKIQIALDWKKVCVKTSKDGTLQDVI